MNRMLAKLRTTKTLLDPAASPEELKTALDAAVAGNGHPTGGNAVSDSDASPSEWYQSHIERVGGGFVSLKSAIAAQQAALDKSTTATAAERVATQLVLDSISAQAGTSFAEIAARLSKKCLDLTIESEKNHLKLVGELRAAGDADRAKRKQALVRARIQYEVDAGAVSAKRADLIVEELKTIEADSNK